MRYIIEKKGLTCVVELLHEKVSVSINEPSSLSPLSEQAITRNLGFLCQLYIDRFKDKRTALKDYFRYRSWECTLQRPALPLATRGK